MKIQHIMIGIALCLAGVQAQAQGYTPAAWEQMQSQNLWLQSQNAAGMVFDASQPYSLLDVGYDWQDGNYHRPQEGEKTSTLGVYSEGLMKLPKAYVWGSFSFQQQNLTDAGYNASITDPFRGMPYYVIDEHLSDWRNQYYDLRFRASTPLLHNRWALGLEGVYQVSLAAKQRDPRVDSRYYNLQVVPSVSYRLSDEHRLGLSLRYESIKEDSRMENENTDIDQPYYHLYGLGTAVQYIGEGRTTNYYGDRFGAALQYNFRNDAWNVLLEGSYDVRAEIVEQTYTNPKKDAGVKDKTARLNLTALRQGADYTHHIRAGYLHRHIDGIQYVTEKVTDAESLTSQWVVLYQSVRSTYATQGATLNYALSRNRGSEYSWKLEADMAYSHQEDEYLLPHSWKTAENLWMGLTAKKNFVLGRTHANRLLVDLHVGLNRNLSGEYVYGGSHADYLSVTALETADAQYHHSDYTRFGGSVTYSQRIKPQEKMHLYVKATYNQISTSDYAYSRRTQFALSAGCCF